jgi:aspartate/methionine/tyrosine aminotransferase
VTIDLGAGSRLNRSGIREVMDLAASLENVLHLEIGEPDFPTPPHVVEAAQRAIADGVVKYTVSRGLPTLRELIAAKLREHNGVDADVDRVVVSAGGTPAILETLMVLLHAGDAADAIELVRGYGGIKLASVDRYRVRLAELGVAAQT